VVIVVIDSCALWLLGSVGMSIGAAINPYFGIQIGGLLGDVALILRPAEWFLKQYFPDF
jgi:hypothetical protein